MSRSYSRERGNVWPATALCVMARRAPMSRRKQIDMEELYQIYWTRSLNEEK